MPSVLTGPHGTTVIKPKTSGTPVRKDDRPYPEATISVGEQAVTIPETTMTILEGVKRVIQTLAAGEILDDIAYDGLVKEASTSRQTTSTSHRFKCFFQDGTEQLISISDTPAKRLAKTVRGPGAALAPSNGVLFPENLDCPITRSWEPPAHSLGDSTDETNFAAGWHLDWATSPGIGEQKRQPTIVETRLVLPDPDTDNTKISLTSEDIKTFEPVSRWG
jgi:hypothetical protein